MGKEHYLVIKEHPFNEFNGRCLDVSGLSNVIVVRSSVDEILNNVDCCLFTLSTLQFDVALERDMPFGLLSKGILSDPDCAPYIGDFSDISEFIMQFAAKEAWQIRRSNIIRKISFLLEFFLLDLHKNSIHESAKRLTQFIEKFKGKYKSTPP